MKLLIYIAELLIVVFLFRKRLWRQPGKGKKRSTEGATDKKPGRFDSQGCDISDGDYKEIR